MADHPLNYAPKYAPEASVARPGRSAGKWLVLLGVWMVGLGVWVVYVAAMIYIFFRYFI